MIVLYKFVTHVIVILFLFLSSCGYKPLYQLSSIFPDNNATLRITSIENPTLISSLPYHFRSTLTKVIAERSIAILKSDPPSQYEMEIIIHSYRAVPRTIVQDDIILLYSIEIVFEAIVYETAKGTPFWRSGKITTSDIYQTFTSEIVIPGLINDAVNDLINSMQLRF